MYTTPRTSSFVGFFDGAVQPHLDGRFPRRGRPRDYVPCSVRTFAIANGLRAPFLVPSAMTKSCAVVRKHGDVRFNAALKLAEVKATGSGSKRIGRISPLRARNNVASRARDCGPSWPRSCGDAAGSVRPLGNLLFRFGLQRPQSWQRGEFFWLTTYPSFLYCGAV